MVDFSKLIESVQLTYGAMKQLTSKTVRGQLVLKFIVKGVTMSTLEEEVNEFLEDRGWKK